MNPLPPISTASLLTDLPHTLPAERFDTLLETPTFRLERILSQGHSTPDGFWYDQPHDEWVLLLQGGARVAIATPEGERLLLPGDSLLLPAHCRHRVSWTEHNPITVWLALHYRADGGVLAVASSLIPPSPP
jgi:cupin 2 domain-containing protein